jgi:GNAT superfamily N-acetyltransferase
LTADGLVIRNMRRAEVDVLVEWAAREGWNPGLHDADAFWANDPDAFIAAELDGEVIGGGAITSYDGEFGFMGFFIVRPEFRGHGYGDVLWNARKNRLLSRLRPGAAIGMDGVLAMQSYYAKGGFVFSHRDVRFRMDVPGDAADAAAHDRGPRQPTGVQLLPSCAVPLPAHTPPPPTDTRRRLLRQTQRIA